MRRRLNAGPAIALSFVIAGDRAAASPRSATPSSPPPCPVAGSAYTFSYASLGELIAWIIGWDLVLELALGAAVVAVGWSGYLLSTRGGVRLDRHPAALGGRDGDGRLRVPASARPGPHRRPDRSGSKLSSLVSTGDHRRDQGRGRAARDRASASFYIDVANYTPFVPPSQRPRRDRPGWLRTADPAPLRLRRRSTFGVLRASSPERRSSSSPSSASTSSPPRPRRPSNPQRDMPRGILGSLLICTRALRAPSRSSSPACSTTPNSIRSSAPLADAFMRVGLDWAAKLISRRRLRRPHHRRHDPAARPDAGAVRHEPRRPAAAWRSAHVHPQYRHAATAHHPASAWSSRSSGRLRQHQRAGGAGEHRHAVRVRASSRSASSSCAAPGPTCTAPSAPRPCRSSPPCPCCPASG